MHPRPAFRSFIVPVVLFATFLFAPFGNRAQLSGPQNPQSGRQMTRDKESTVGEVRLALVIGNGAYQYAGRLPNPVTDAAEVAKALREVGFDALVGTDCTKEAMERLIDDFGVKLARAGERAVGVFYYAGHGVQIKGSNYLIPVDARAQTESDVRYRAVDVDFLLGKMEDAKSGVNIVILDACRDNPFSRSFRNSANGLAQVTAPRGTLIAYATSPGKVATDSGVYRTSLITALRTPGLNVLDVFQEVGAKVDRETSGQQTPWQSSSLTGRFFFVPPIEVAKSKPPSVKPSDPAVAEQEAWEVVRESTDPEDYREFLKLHPNGLNAGTAKLKLRKLESAATPAPTKPTGSDSPLRPPATSRPGAPSPGTQMEGPAGIKFVFIPAGEFQMGSENGDGDEKPVHRVVITAPFWMGKYEVTQAEWEAVMGRCPDERGWGFPGPNNPADQISWDDCQKFIQNLNAKGDGYTYRLPTEAEWEYACRAGMTGDYAGVLDAKGWYNQNSGEKTHQVGQKLANGWGLCDMHGNVWEWCQDWYGAYQRDWVTNPTGPTSGSYRVLRGGCWFNTAAGCRPANRNSNWPGTRFNALGFRLVRIQR